MNALRQIPLHMLLLAGLAGPLNAQETPGAATAPKTAAAKPTTGAMQAYAGLSVNVLGEAERAQSQVRIPDGVGLGVVLVDPKGPAAGLLEVGDILTRLDDQVLVSPDQFRTLVRMRKGGDKVKLVVVHESAAKTIELELAEKAAPERRTLPTSPRVAAGAPAPGSPMSITINGQQIDLGNVPGGNGTVTQVGPGHVVIIGPNQGLPPEVKKQLEEMRARGLPIPPLDLQGLAVDPAQGHAAGKGTTQQFSKSFSFSLGGPGATSTSSSIASDDQGTVSLEQKDGKKHAVIKDKDGNVTFDGDVTTDEQRAQMPAAARDRLKLVEGSSFSIDGLGGKSPAAPAPEKPKKKRNPKEGA